MAAKAQTMIATGLEAIMPAPLVVCWGGVAPVAEGVRLVPEMVLLEPAEWDGAPEAEAVVPADEAEVVMVDAEVLLALA
jgi:hypothetical protein